MVDLLKWLRDELADYQFRPAGVLLEPDTDAIWPIESGSLPELLDHLEEHDALSSLPREPAALANVVETSLVEYLTERLAELRSAGHDVSWGSAGERNYPDLEISGEYFSESGEPEHQAIDVKVARRNKTEKGTQSRITLYTGNTYFKYPHLHWPGNLRPFEDYARHLDVLIIYNLNTESRQRVEKLEVIVHETWRIASRERSSTTRNYIGAVTTLDDLRAGNGHFTTPEEFYAHWAKHPFPQSAQVAKILNKIVKEQKAKYG